MYGTIIEEMSRLIQQSGEQVALGEVLDSIHTALGPRSRFSDYVADARDKVRNHRSRKG